MATKKKNIATLTKEQRRRLLEWITALESGKFRRAEGTLRIKSNADTRKPSYCCLGVACELYRQATGKGVWIDGSYGGRNTFRLGKTYNDTFPPSEVMKMFGINGINVKGLRAKERIKSMTAADMNDAGYSFKEIAAALRKKFNLPEED